MKTILASISVLILSIPVASGYVPAQTTQWKVNSSEFDKIQCEWMLRAYPEGLRKEFMCFTTL